MVTWVNKNIGATIRDGEALAKIADLSSFKVQGSISDTYLDQVRPGMKGVAWTAFEGTSPEAVPVELIGLWKNAWGFDWLYDLLFVKPFMLIVRVNARDGFDAAVGFLPWLVREGHHVLAKTQSGKLRWYAATMAIGLVLVVAGFALV